MKSFNPLFLLLCGCPKSDAIKDIPTSDCKEIIGQIQRFGVQRQGNTVSAPETLASWNVLKTAADSTKVQFTPRINAPTLEPGEAIEFGSGNAVTGGIPIVVGRSPSKFTGLFHWIKQSIIKAIKSFECETASVFLVNQYGQIIGLSKAGDGSDFKGIPIRSFFVGDKKFGGFEEPDTNAVSWSFNPNWSDDLYVVTPTFDPLTEL